MRQRFTPDAPSLGRNSRSFDQFAADLQARFNRLLQFGGRPAGNRKTKIAKFSTDLILFFRIEFMSVLTRETISDGVSFG